uniref:F-box domain-containing protein n=1 Tax=Romanomermis culicivorax TaxID=13658 RepID=A0A915IHP9_ROMCU
MENLPYELILKILSHLSFDEISRIRLTNKSLDLHCRHCLNSGFQKVERYHTSLSQKVKSQLPRRESERRNHELSRHSDILGAVDTRLSLLSMTFNKYIDSDVCCFIPGKVLDELFRLLRLVDQSLVENKSYAVATNTELPRPHELLKELRDISSMAMEYFDEVLVHDFRETFANRMQFLNLSNTLSLLSESTTMSPQADTKNSAEEEKFAHVTSTPTKYAITRKTGVNDEISKTPTVVSKSSDQSNVSLHRTIISLRRRLTVQNTQIKSNEEQIKQMSTRLTTQDRKLAAQSKLIRQQSSLIVDVNKRLLELNSKLTDFETHVTKEKSASTLKRVYSKTVGDDESGNTAAGLCPKKWKN